MRVDGATTDRKDYWVTKVLPKIDLVRGWARNGLTNAQIAKNLDIGATTFYDFLNKHAQLQEILRSAREDAEIMVENAMFKKALGYTSKEVTRERRKVKDEYGNEDWEMVTTKSVTKQVAGDFSAQQYWLEHRAPKRWEKNVTGEIDTSATNAMIKTIAELINRPVAVRPVGSEID